MGTRPRRHGALALLLLLGACAYTPVTASLAPPPLAQSTRIFATDGSLITQLLAEENREDVRLDQLPDHLLDAVIAIEDARFWQHKGVDVKAILRAAITNASQGDVVEGGSTITQQYVKTALLHDDRTLDRKVEEAILAVQLERRYTKERILELYLNTIYFGAGAYGVQAAAETYFQVPVTELDLSEAATLAGLIRSPESSDPFDHPDEARRRRDVVLRRMAELGLATDDEVAFATAAPLGVEATRPEHRYPAAHFVERVKRFVLDDPRFGETAAERRALLFGGGLRITTTLDPRQQLLAEAAVAEVRPPAPGPDAALVALEPGTGFVRALVGGRDFFANEPRAKLDLATGGVGRHAGSSFKPLVLAAALQNGVSLDRTYPAPGRTTIELPHETWEVSNYEGGGGGIATLREATVRSYNTVYARLIMDVGPEAAVDLAARMGIAAPLSPNPSAVLGTNDVHPIDMASAYGTLANRGVHAAPVFVTQVARQDGTILYRHQPAPERVLRADVADTVTSVLQEAVERGTGTRARVDGRPVAGKTGTSQQWRDAWFVGYTPQLVTAVWIGFAEASKLSMVPPATPIRVTGGSWPAEIWRRFMQPALEDEPVLEFRPPPAPAPADPADRPAAPTPTPVAVPPVVGLLFDLAAERLRDAGHRVERVDVPSAEYPPGVVVSQTPLVGGSVTLRVAAPSPDAVVVPNVIGMDVEQATAALVEAGLGAAVVVGAAEVAPGQVWRQEPGADVTVGRGREVTVWVAE